MDERIVDGIVMPDDENVVIVPTGYTDPVITKEHFAQKGENIITCNMLVQDLMSKIGTEVVCPECGKKFMVVKQEDMSHGRK